MKNFKSAAILAGVIMAASAGMASADSICGMNTGEAATGEPIPIGAIMTASGGGDVSPGTYGAKAYFDCVNDNGGINGRPIAFTFEDDQLQPAKDMELAKRLVEDLGVVAMVGSSSVVECITTSGYYEEQGIISLMATGITPQCFTSKNVAPLNQGPRLNIIAQMTYAVEHLDAKKIVCTLSQFPGADWICDGARLWAEAHGIDYSQILYDAASTDNESLVTQIFISGADTAVTSHIPPTFISMMNAAEALDAGSRVHFLAPTPVYHPAVPNAIGPYWNDNAWVPLEFAPLDAGTPDVVNFNAVMAEYYDGDPTGLTQGGYLAAKLATEAMLSLDPANITRETVTAALQSVQNFESDMLCNPWAFGDKDATSHVGNTGARIAMIHDGGWKVGECYDYRDEELSK